MNNLYKVTILNLVENKCKTYFMCANSIRNIHNRVKHFVNYQHIIKSIDVIAVNVSESVTGREIFEPINFE